MRWPALQHPWYWPLALILATLLSAGCSSLQIDVDVYKGPLAHEAEIQVKQYASLATSAKPLLEDLYRKELAANNKPVKDVVPSENCKNRQYREQFLCEILSLYNDERPPPGPEESVNLFRSQSRKPELGLDSLTFAVTKAMAEPVNEGSQKSVAEAVAALNEALIFFAQKLLYVTNNELLFGDGQTYDKKAAPVISVLQSLGNTILVHANDLQRQQSQQALHTKSAASDVASMEQAFQPPPTVTMDAILKRLERYSPVAPAAAQDTLRGAATPEQKTRLDNVQSEYRSYLAGIATLLAAYRTVNGELASALAAEPPDAADVQAAQADRQAIAALYPGTVPTAPGAPALKPLNDWIDREVASQVVTAPGRPARLRGLKDYLTTEAATLGGVGAGRGALVDLQNYLAAQVSLAVVHASALLAKTGPLLKEIDAQNQQEALRVAALARKAAAADTETIRTKIVAVVQAVRADVLQSAERLHTRDPRIITNLLLERLRDIVRTGKGDKFSVEDTQLTIRIVETFTPPDAPCTLAGLSQQCRASTTVEVVDQLISSLRAQRVQAIATGDTPAAENLLKAINVAYEQRTAMIYLRPASDYLRSVYSSTSLQEGTDQQYRNMLTDWFKKYLNPWESDTKNLGRKELEKIHWQNVNKVTVSGGGFTNYVIAKDDVGNWYVKAYGSDPDAIIKSATSLALFNSGKEVNINLLRRFDAQRQLDDDRSLSTERRAELRKELDAPDWQGGQALLKVRDRYAGRYIRETAQQASALLALANALPDQTQAAIEQGAQWTATCPASAATGLVKPLDATYVVAPRTRLSKAVAATTDPAKVSTVQLVELEQSMQAMLTGLHLYSSDVPRVLRAGEDTACVALQHTAGEAVRKTVRVQVANAASARRASIERYEDALSNVLEVATAK